MLALLAGTGDFRGEVFSGEGRNTTDFSGEGADLLGEGATSLLGSADDFAGDGANFIDLSGSGRSSPALYAFSMLARR